MEHLCDIDCEFAICDLRYSEIVTRLSASEEKINILREAIKAIPILEADKEINAIRDKALAAAEDK